MPVVYPALSIPSINTKGSKQLPVDDLVVDQWPNGSSRGRSYFTVGLKAWELLHGVIPDADRVTLETFYNTNKLILFDFVSPWDGVTYHNVGFVMVPDYERLPGLLWNVKTKLRQFF